MIRPPFDLAAATAGACHVADLPECGRSHISPDWERSSLWRCPDGSHFLAGEGGPESRWGVRLMPGVWLDGAGVIALSLAEANALLDALMVAA